MMSFPIRVLSAVVRFSHPDPGQHEEDQYASGGAPSPGAAEELGDAGTAQKTHGDARCQQ